MHKVTCFSVTLWTLIRISTSPTYSYNLCAIYLCLQQQQHNNDMFFFVFYMYINDIQSVVVSQAIASSICVCVCVCMLGVVFIYIWTDVGGGRAVGWLFGW